MSSNFDDEIVAVTQRLLDSIAGADWEAYQSLCHPQLTAFEPEACGHLVEGMPFHQTYFAAKSYGDLRSTISSPRVWELGENAAVIAYVRLNQTTDADGKTTSSAFEETRVWRKDSERWLHVHFHRS